jgi:hypothetical protein
LLGTNKYGGGRSSSSQQDSALLNTHICLNDINKGEVSFAETSNSHVDISGIYSSITAKNLKLFLQTLHKVYSTSHRQMKRPFCNWFPRHWWTKTNLTLKMSFCNIGAGFKIVFKPFKDVVFCISLGGINIRMLFWVRNPSEYIYNLRPNQEQLRKICSTRSSSRNRTYTPAIPVQRYDLDLLIY